MSNASIWEGPSGDIPVVNADGNVFLETQIATAGQTVFTLQSFKYTPGTNSLFVFKNGSLLRIATAYTETDDTHITLATGAAVNDVLSFLAFAVTQVTPTLANNGVPAGGTTGQLLGKKSGSDYDLNWVDLNSLPSLTDGLRVNVASASTVDLTPLSGTTRNILITGNLEIDGFMITAGELFFVKFGGALVLKNNAAIVTGTGADIGVSVNDTCMIRATGANTVEVLTYNKWSSPNVPIKQDFRLTLTSGVPVPVGDVTAATTIYLTPYIGNQISLYNGKGWELFTSSELSYALTSRSVNRPQDVFVYNNAGVLTLDIVEWTSQSVRATALAKQDGVYVKSGDATRRYVGSFCTTSTVNQTEDSARRRLVWNYYNRVARNQVRQETAANWTYTTASWRQTNANALNQLEIMVGVQEDYWDLDNRQSASNTSAGVSVYSGIGLDSTTTQGANTTNASVTSPAAGTYLITPQSRCTFQPAAGYHYAAQLEQSSATGTTTWYGNGSTGIYGQWRC